MPRHCVLPSPLTAITRTVTVAGGRFAPGHLGELTAVVPFELVDAVLAETRTADCGPVRDAGGMTVGEGVA